MSSSAVTLFPRVSSSADCYGFVKRSSAGEVVRAMEQEQEAASVVEVEGKVAFGRP